MPTLSRRRFLVALGWGAAGITAVAGGGAWALMPTLPPRYVSNAAAWLSLRPDGVFELYSSRAEMGQGISIGLRQVAADELGVGLDRVRLVQRDTSLIPVARSTVGSDAICETGMRVARAAALAVAVLREAAKRSAFRSRSCIWGWTASWLQAARGSHSKNWGSARQCS